MTEREALLAAICDNPDEDTPRLVFADWLDENGEPERAEFIRVQMNLAALFRHGTPGTEPLAKRSRELWERHGAKWQRDLPNIMGVTWHNGCYRGFVELATLVGDTVLVKHADTAFRQVPIRHLEIKKFQCVKGFITWPGLKHLKTLKLYNSRINQSVVRELLKCEELNKSALVWCYFGGMPHELELQLRTKFGGQLMAFRS